MAYSLVFSCCCYTCCFRRKLRNMLNIKVTNVPTCKLRPVLFMQGWMLGATICFFCKFRYSYIIEMQMINYCFLSSWPRKPKVCKSIILLGCFVTIIMTFFLLHVLSLYFHLVFVFRDMYSTSTFIVLRRE